MDARASPASARRRPRRRFLNLIGESLVGWVRDGAPSMGAAIAFYTLFATAPLLIMVISVADAVLGRENAERHVLSQLQQLLGDQAFGGVQTLLTNVHLAAHSRLSTVAGAITLLIGASSVFAELQNALNKIWRAQPRSAVQGLWHAVRARLLAFALVFIVGLLLMLLLIASSGLAMLGGWLGGYITESHQVVWLLDLVLGFALATLLFAIIYKYVPRESIGWREVWVGSVVTAFLFSSGRLIMVMWLRHTPLNSLYGFAGSFLLLLLWVYYSAQIFLLGAEFTYLYAQSSGSRSARARAPSRADR